MRKTFLFLPIILSGCTHDTGYTSVEQCVKAGFYTPEYCAMAYYKVSLDPALELPKNVSSVYIYDINGYDRSGKNPTQKEKNCPVKNDELTIDTKMTPRELADLERFRTNENAIPLNDKAARLAQPVQPIVQPQEKMKVFQ